MQTKTPDWSKYQRLVQQSCAYLSANDEKNSLLKLSLQLATLRLTLPDTSTERLKQHAPLPVALQQIEVILLLCKYYGWPDKVCHLLLQAGFCSVLCQAMPQRQHWPKLQHFPALLAARLLHSDADNNPLQTILAGSYPTERNIAPWRQNPLSLLLTQAEYLSSPRASLQQLLGRRIALSKSEYELQLLRRILACLYQPQHDNDTTEVDFFNQSQFTQLYDADTSTLEQYLQQDPHLAAPVLARASQLNRQRQQISNLHLALNLLGRAQIPAMLAEAELHYNLSRLHHPQQALLQQFSTCLARACDLLLPGQHSRSYWQALALCLCAPLWRAPQGYMSALSTRTAVGYHLSSDDNSKQQDYTLRLITDLLQHYQLTEWLQPAVSWLSATTACRETKTLTLQLAWHSCNALLLNARSQLLSALIPQAQQQKLPVKTLTSWLTQLASESQCYYPLELSL